MKNGCVAPDRILSKLDEYLHKKDFDMAERHLRYWLSEALANGDVRTEQLIRNELMGLYRKLGREREAIDAAQAALDRTAKLGLHGVGAATTYLNAATVKKAFGKAEEAIPLFEEARAIYERDLPQDDTRLGGLYNNMGLALVDVGRFAEADALYRKAIETMTASENGAAEAAITYLNLASAAEAELGLEEAGERINAYLEQAEALLESCGTRDGYYAFVCEKCATVFGYYGFFAYAKELSERARRIYEGT